MDTLQWECHERAIHRISEALVKLKREARKGSA